jgi:predicted secreted hydrolase
MNMNCRPLLRWIVTVGLGSIFFIGCTPLEEALTNNGDEKSYNQILKGEQNEGYRQATPGTKLQFPEDHGEHPDYRIEWWYLTANLTDENGRHYGIQFTLFRNRIKPPAATTEEHSAWATPQIYMAHAALSTPTGHYAAEKFARGGVGLVSVQADPFQVRIEDWSLVSATKSAQINDSAASILPLQLTLYTKVFALSLTLSGNGVIALHGEGGFSRKHPTNEVGSYYYSMPHLSISGQVKLPMEEGGGLVTVSGQAWLDREWSSQYLSTEQTGWDWLSLHLEDGRGLMAFRLRQLDGNHYIYGSLISADGEVTALDGTRLLFEPIEYANVSVTETGGKARIRSLPVGWKVVLPEASQTWHLHALHADQQMNTLFPYWEGAVLCEAPKQCRGYLELTGY